MTQVQRALNEAAVPGVTGYNSRLSRTKAKSTRLHTSIRASSLDGWKRMYLQMYRAWCKC